MKISIVLCTIITLTACGGAAKAPVKIVNDEVSTPMTIEDVEATEDVNAKGSDSSSAPDAMKESEPGASVGPKKR